MSQIFRTLVSLSLLSSAALVSGQQPDAPPQLPRPRSEVDLVIGDRIGTQPRIAVPDCLALSGEAETAAIAKTIAEVLWDDLDFEREFRMVARDTYESVPPARSLTDLPLDDWRELGADGIVSCSVERVGDDQLRLTARLFNARSMASAFGVEYSGSIGSVRTYAHQLSDEIHRHQRGLRGVARSKDRVHLGSRQRIDARSRREPGDQGGVLRRL